MESDRDGAGCGWAGGCRWCCEEEDRDGDGEWGMRINGMDAAIQSNPDSGGFSSRCDSMRGKGSEFLTPEVK
jgi:hypothetical protein